MRSKAPTGVVPRKSRRDDCRLERRFEIASWVAAIRAGIAYPSIATTPGRSRSGSIHQTQKYPVEQSSHRTIVLRQELDQALLEGVEVLS